MTASCCFYSLLLPPRSSGMIPLDGTKSDFRPPAVELLRKLAALPCLTSLAIKGCESVSLAAVERLKREAPALRTVGFSI